MDGQKLLELYEKMYLVRRFEESAAEQYTKRNIGGFLHLCIGQEAVGAGVMEALQPQDYITTTYRDHGHFIFRGGDPKAAMAELFGKATGCSKGRGGSMHFFDTNINFLGGHGIVGAHAPLSTGTAFAAKYRGEDSVSVCFLGDGAVSIGPFHEALCLASLWKLPVVFIVENNRYSMGTPLSRTMVTEDSSVRALGYPMSRASVEGSDVVECHYAAKQAIDRARNESMPTLLEYRTYRYRGHSMADPAKYRTKEELKEWKDKDPLILCKQRIETDYPHLAGEIPGIRQRVDAQAIDIVRFAEESPEPALESVEDYTYV